MQALIAMQLQFHSGRLEAAAVLAAAGLACLGAWVLLREHDTGESGARHVWVGRSTAQRSADAGGLDACCAACCA